MKTIIIIVAVIFALFILLPAFIKGAIKRRNKRAQAIEDALALVAEAGLTAYNKEDDMRRSRRLDQAVETLKRSGYKITPK